MSAAAVLAGCGGAAVEGPPVRQPAAASADATAAPTPLLPPAPVLAENFLNSWMDGDGRIVRRDQGGDTVSEGQAYGMLLAVAANDRVRFAQIWTWTQANLMRPNGLLAWRWIAGAVTDDQAAADADVDTATALFLGGQRFAEPAYTSAASALAAAVLARETVPTSAGPLLTAGPWAVANPAVLNPSYVVGGTADTLGARTGVPTWAALAAATRALDANLVSSSRLPPDWARLANEATPTTPSAAVASGAPNSASAPSYGLDAARLLIRLASSCSSVDRALAARASSIVGAIGQPAVRALNGTPQVTWQHPVADVAVAAVASASGDTAGMHKALAAAAALDRQSPTYYGAAWVALGSVLLTSTAIGSCAPGAQ